MLDGGRVVGTWAQEVRGGRLRLTVAPFAGLRPGLPGEVEAEAERWAAYAGCPPALEWEAP